MCLCKICRQSLFSHLYENENRISNFIKKEALAQVFSCEFCEISKNAFSYRTPLVAASDSKLSELTDDYNDNDYDNGIETSQNVLASKAEVSSGEENKDEDYAALSKPY